MAVFGNKVVPVCSNSTLYDKFDDHRDVEDLGDLRTPRTTYRSHIRTYIHTYMHNVHRHNYHIAAMCRYSHNNKISFRVKVTIYIPWKG